MREPEQGHVILFRLLTSERRARVGLAVKLESGKELRGRCSLPTAKCSAASRAACQP